MKLKIDEKQAERDGALTEKVFNVKSSPQTFKILADNLYSNKNRAVIRELACNSHDAHIQKYGPKANEVLIDIHIPNYIEQWFSIRDYGNGMSHEFMMGEVEVDGQKVGYCTAFHSSKSNSNDESGLYGLGKLAVLSVTDSYSIVSITDSPESDVNIKRCYTVCRERGCPVIIFMGESKTTEKTGVEISVPISDYLGFEREVIGFLSNLDIKFNISGTSSKPRNSEIVLNRNSWRVFKTDSYSSSGVMAKMGIVRYPIDQKYCSDFNFSYRHIEIDFPMGSIEVTPSREALSYSKDTIEYIKKRIEEVRSEIIEEAQNKLNNITNLWDARRLMWDFHRGRLSQFSNFIAEKVKYKDQSVGYAIDVAPNWSSGIKNISLKTSWRRGSNGAQRVTTSSVRQIETSSDNIEIIIDDQPKCANRRLLKHLSSFFGNLFLFSVEEWNKNKDKFEGLPIGLADENGTQKRYLIDDIEPQKLSELPYDPIIRVKGSRKSKIFDAGEVYYVSGHSTYGGGSYDSYRLWSDNSALPKEGYYIVAGKNERYMLNGYNNRYPKKLEFCKELDIKTDYVFAIHPRKEKSFLKQYPDWKPATELDEKIKKELDKRLKGVIVEQVNSTLMGFLRGFVAVKEFHSNPKVSKLKTLIDGYDHNKYQILEGIARFYGIKIPESLEISNAYAELHETYPLLHLADGQMYKIEEYKAEWAKYLGC